MHDSVYNFDNDVISSRLDSTVRAHLSVMPETPFSLKNAPTTIDAKGKGKPSGASRESVSLAL